MSKKVWWIIIVAALGYFVDIYDLILFNMIKKESLYSLGLDQAAFENYELVLFSWQMWGMLIGGLLWGILGDKKGRVIVLFGSILMYSLANIANAFVVDMTTYKILRFVAGIGLAGELGAGVTLVSETIEKSKRGIGTMILVSFGALGAVAAFFVGDKGHLINNIYDTGLQNWQLAYIVGGVLGLMLLLLRTANLESDMFNKMKDKVVEKGNFIKLISDKKLLKLYTSCIAIGVPIWFMVALLPALASRYSQVNSGIEVEVSMCILLTYIGLSSGDFFSGLLSQWVRNRKKIIYLYLIISIVSSLIFLFAKNQSATFYYVMSYVIGFGTGYWALFVLNGAEQFGTNLRSTAATTIPNFVRGSVVPILAAFKFLSDKIGTPVYPALIVGAVCFTLAFLGTWYIKDGFDVDLDYEN